MKWVCFYGNYKNTVITYTSNTHSRENDGSREQKHKRGRNEREREFVSCIKKAESLTRLRYHMKIVV